MAQLLEAVFKPETKTVREIFDGGNYYQVPDYQRPYSWDDEQIEQLWDDLLSAFNNNDSAYFLGPVILSRAREGYNEIIDGQQRLTTLTILFCVLRDLYFPKDNKVLNRVKSLEEERYRLRLITQMNYQNQFEQEILNHIDFPKAKPTGKAKQDLFLNTAWILRQKLSELESLETVEKFVDYLLNNVVMITITCSSLASAIKLFQVLNTRGMELNNADLLKSYLYSKLDNELERRKFIATWSEVENIARQMDEPLEELFTYYEYYVLARVAKRTLYEEFRDEFENKDSNAIIYEFKKFVEYYYDIYRLQSKVAYSLWYLPNQVFWKSILISAKMSEFSEFGELLIVMRQLYYTYWIAGYTTAKLRQLSLNIISMLKNHKTIDDIRREIRKSVDKDMVVERFNQSLEADVYGSPWLKPVMVMTEYAQTDDSRIAFIEIHRNLHIDHILPEEWPSVKYWVETWSEDEAEKHLNKIGNLALLSGRKNIAASNSSFLEKKQIYHGTGLDGKTGFLTSQAVVEKEDWTAKEVLERQEHMVSKIKTLFDIQKLEERQTGA